MRNYILSFTVLILTFMCTSPVFAEMTCPDGLVLLTDPQTGYKACLKDTSNAEKLYERMRSTGFAFSFGVGYATNSQIFGSFRIGYDFGTLNEDQNFGIALYTDLNAAFGEPAYSIALTLTPSFYTIYKSFRFSADLGVGIDFFDNYTRDNTYEAFYSGYDYTHDYYITNKSFCFIILPQFHFDWFVTDYVWLGFSFKFRLSILYDHIDYLPNTQHVEYSDNPEPILATVPTFMVEAFHFGFKF